MKTCDTCYFNENRGTGEWFILCVANDTEGCRDSNGFRTYIHYENALKNNNIITCKKCGLNFYFKEYQNENYCVNCDK